MFNLAMDWHWPREGANSCRSAPKYKERKRERFLSDEEFRRLGDVLNPMETEGSLPLYAVVAIRLLMLTGCRRNENLDPRWCDVNLKAGELRLREAKGWDMVPEDLVDPCQSIPMNPKRRRERFLTDAEFTRLGQVLDEVSGKRSQISAGAITTIRLLMLTGCRRNEILTLRWKHFDLDRAGRRDRGRRVLRLPQGLTRTAAPAGQPQRPRVCGHSGERERALETAGLMRLACAEPIRVRETKYSQLNQIHVTNRPAHHEGSPSHRRSGPYIL